MLRREKAAAVKDHTDASVACALAEHAKQDVVATCASLGESVAKLQAKAETATLWIQWLEATLEASSMVAEDKAAEVDGCFFLSSSALFWARMLLLGYRSDLVSLV